MWMMRTNRAPICFTLHRSIPQSIFENHFRSGAYSVILIYGKLWRESMRLVYWLQLIVLDGRKTLPRSVSVRRGGLTFGGTHADVKGKVRTDSSRMYMCGRFGVTDSPPDSPLSLPPPFSTMLSMRGWKSADCLWTVAFEGVIYLAEALRFRVGLAVGRNIS